MPIRVDTLPGSAVVRHGKKVLLLVQGCQPKATWFQRIVSTNYEAQELPTLPSSFLAVMSTVCLDLVREGLPIFCNHEYSMPGLGP